MEVADAAVEDQAAPGGVGDQPERVGHGAAHRTGVAEAPLVEHVELATGRHRDPFHGQVLREDPADLRIADDPAVQHHDRDHRAVRADQRLREVGDPG